MTFGRLRNVLVLCWIPFLGRPWLVDDPSFIRAGQLAIAHPLNPFSSGQTNPPLGAWMLGLVIRLFGTGPVALHATLFAACLIALWAANGLLRKLHAESPEILVALAASPVFFLTTFTLYPD